MENAGPQELGVSARWRAGRIAAGALTAGLCLAQAGVIHPSDKLTDDEKISLVRDLTAEYANARDILPRSKKALEFNSDGTYDKKKWQSAVQEGGPAARVGDKVQVTKVTLEGDKLLLEINHGFNSGKHWYDHVQVGMGSTTQPINSDAVNPNLGTTIEVDFHKPMENLTAADVKKMLAPVLDFDKRSATVAYAETLPPEVKQAIAEKRAMEGMDREQVLLALGHPDRKYRESKDGLDTEDWIYGTPPGKITFVTFGGSKVVKVKEQYAGLGIQTAAQQPTP